MNFNLHCMFFRILVLCFCALFVGCSDEEGVGSIIQPEEDFLHSYSNGLGIETSTVESGSVLSKSDNFLLGRYKDQKFGEVKAEFLTQLDARLGAGLVLPDINVVSANSGKAGILDTLLKALDKKFGLMKSIKDTIGSLIADAEQKDSEAKFDADGLRRILGEVLASMSNSTVMNIKDLTNNVVGRIMDVAQDCDVSFSVGKADEATAKNEISSRANDVRRMVETKLRDLFDEFNTDLNKKLEKSKNEVVDIFKGRKDELIIKAKDSVEGYLVSLEKELNDKKAQLENYKRAIASINEIENIL